MSLEPVALPSFPPSFHFLLCLYVCCVCAHVRVYMCVCVYTCVRVCPCVCGSQRTTGKSSFSFSVMWVLGVKLRLSAFVECPFDYCAISLCPPFIAHRKKYPSMIRLLVFYLPVLPGFKCGIFLLFLHFIMV